MVAESPFQVVGFVVFGFDEVAAVAAGHVFPGGVPVFGAAPGVDRDITFLTEEGQRLYRRREALGLSNELCPLCEDEESFGEPCQACIDAGRDL